MKYCAELRDALADLQGEAPRLLLGTPRGLVCVDTHTYDMETVLLTEGAVHSEHPPGAFQETGLPIAVIDDVDTSSGTAFGICKGQLVCAIASAFRPQVAVVELRSRPPLGEFLAAANALGGHADMHSGRPVHVVLINIAVIIQSLLSSLQRSSFPP